VSPRAGAAIGLIKNLYRAKGLASAVSPELEKKIGEIIKNLSNKWESSLGDLNVLAAYDFSLAGMRALDEGYPMNSFRLVDSEDIESLRAIKNAFQYLNDTAMQALEEIDRGRAERTDQ
jgi:hypothetical protein